MNFLIIEFGMWLLLFASIVLVFAMLLLEFVWKDSADYDMRYLWNYNYTPQDLHLDPEQAPRHPDRL